MGHCPLPFVAIGGINEHNIGEVARHGARLICTVTEILEADDIGKKIAALRKKIDSATQNSKLKT